MYKLNVIRKQTQKIREYGEKVGYLPNDDVFHKLTYLINGLMNVISFFASEDDAIDIVVDVQEQMLLMLKDHATFQQAFLYAEEQYLLWCEIAGVLP